VPKLDPIDHQILSHLRTDGRISNVHLAAKVKLSPSACLRRVQLLEKSKAIRGYVAVIDDKRIETISVIVHVTLEQQTASFLNRFEAAVRKCPDVAECYLMTGVADYFLRVEARNMVDYERIHKEQLSQLPGLARIQSSFTIRQVIPIRT
jgi:DNA-binding Lrp family transcriptional regulator